MRVAFNRGTAEILEMCGTSLFGKISRARILETEEVFACMEIDYSIISSEEWSKLQKEIEILPQLAHKHVVRYLEAVHDHEAKMSYLLMEHFTVGDLTEVTRMHRKEHTRLEEERIWRIFSQLLLAMDYCHSIRKPNAINIGSMVHRNIIPNNIFVGDGDLIKLGYFSLHQILSSNSVIKDAASPFYTAPEVLQELPYTEKADIWSLGCVLYELCSLQRPFIGSGQMSLIDTILQNTREPIPDMYSPELSEVINLMLNINPNARPSAMDLLGRPKFGAIGVHKSMLDAQNQDIDMLISNIKSRDQSLQEAAEEIDKLHGEVEALRSEVTVTEDALFKNAQQLESTVKELQKYKEEHQSLQDRYELEVQENEENQVKIQSQMQQIDDFAVALEDLNNLLIAHEDDIKALNKDLSDKELIISNLERKLESNSADRDKQQVKIDSLKEILTRKEGEFDQIKIDLMKSQEKVAILEREKEEVTIKTSFIPELESQIDALKRNSASKEHDFQSAIARISTLTLELEWVKQALAEKTEGYETLQGEFRDMRTRYNDVSIGHADLIKALQEAEARIKSQDAQLLERNNLVSQLEEQVRLANIQLSSKEQEVISKSVESEELKESVASLKEQLNNAILEMEQLRSANSEILQERIAQNTVLEQKNLELEKSRAENRSLERSQMRKPKNRYEAYMKSNNLTIFDTPMDTPLMQAVIRNDPLDKHMKYARTKDAYGRTALMRAAYYNNISAVRLLVNLEGKMQDADGNTALMFAVDRGNAECAKVLLKVEAGYLTREGRTALMRAAYNGNAGMAGLLCELEGGITTSDGLTALMLGALMEHAGIVSILRKREGSMVLLDGTPALLMAASTGNMEVIRLLFYSEGNIRDAANRTALIVAAEMGHLEAVRFFASTQSGATTTDGETALMIASIYGHTSVAQVLFYREAGIQRQDGWTAMMYAATFGHCSIIDMLHRREGNLRTLNGWTAFMHAVENNQLEAAGLLAQVEGNLRDNSGKTALDHAKSAGNKEMVAFLKSIFS